MASGATHITEIRRRKWTKLAVDHPIFRIFRQPQPCRRCSRVRCIDGVRWRVRRVISDHEAWVEPAE